MYPLLEITTVPIEIQMKTTNASLEYTKGSVEMEIVRSEKSGVEVKSGPIQVQLDTFELRGDAFQAATANAVAAVQASNQASQLANQTKQPVSQPAASPVSNAALNQSAAAQGSYRATSAFADGGAIQFSFLLSGGPPQTQQAVPQNTQLTAPETQILPQEPQYVPPQAQIAAPEAQILPQNSGGAPAQVPEFPKELKDLPDERAIEIRYNMDQMKFSWDIQQGKFTFIPGDIEFTMSRRPSITYKYLGEPIYVPASADPNYEPVDTEA